MTTPNKKTFKEALNKETLSNPALSFISPESITKAEGAGKPQDPDGVLAPNAGGSSTAEGEGVQPKRTARKKMLDLPTGVPVGYKPNTLYIQTRNKRVQLLLQPDLYDKLKARADVEGTSMNNLVNLFLEEALDELSAREEQETEGGEE